MHSLYSFHFTRNKNRIAIYLAEKDDSQQKIDIAYLSADADIEKTEQFTADVKQYQTDKAERELGNVGNVEAVNPVELAGVAEPEFQYGAEAFEAYQKETEKAATKDKATKNVPAKNGKSR